MIISAEILLCRCISVDLEVDPKTARILDFAAVCDDERAAIRATKDIGVGLARIEAACADVQHLIGQNIIRHDLPHLGAARSRLEVLANAPINTLWLNPSDICQPSPRKQNGFSW